MKGSLLARVISEPYRIFFPFGIIAGIIGVSHWLFYGLGWIESYSMIQHSSIQMQVYIASFVTGFLLTSMPRFASAPPASGPEFFSFLAVMLFTLTAYLIGHIACGQAGFTVLLLALGLFAFKRMVRKKKAGIMPPLEFLWLPAAFFLGLAGTALFFSGMKGWLPAWSAAIGKPMMDQGFVLALVIGVGSFLGPRLMGVYNPPFKFGSPGYEEKIKKLRRSTTLFHSSMAVLLALSFVLEGLQKTMPAFWLRAIIITLVYLKTRALTFVPNIKDQFAVLLCVSFWMVFLGHWAMVFFPALRAAMLHIILIGGYSLMTFAVGTMVIFSHAGLSNVLRKNSWQLTFIAAALAIALILRIAALFYPAYFFKILGIASAFWLASAVCWLFYILPPALRSVGEEDIERCHEEAKQRVQKLRET